MPYVPRQMLSNSGGLRQELTTPSKPPIPFMGSQEQQQRRPSARLGIPRVSLKDSVDPDRVLALLFGDRFQTNEFTHALEPKRDS